MEIDKEIEDYLIENFGSIYGNQSVSEAIKFGYELALKKVKENDSLHDVSNRDAICKECQKKMIIDMMNEQVYCDDCGDWACGKCDNLDCKHK